MQPIIINNMTFAYPGQNNLFENCNLDLESSWKLGLLGRNGRGKTTLLKIFQHQLDYTGTIQCNLGFASFPLVITPDSAGFAIDDLCAAVPILQDEQ